MTASRPSLSSLLSHGSIIVDCACRGRFGLGGWYRAGRCDRGLAPDGHAGRAHPAGGSPVPPRSHSPPALVRGERAWNDYEHGPVVKIMLFDVPAAWLAMEIGR